MSDTRKRKSGQTDAGWGAFGDPFKASFDMSQAWMKTWGSILEKRGGPAAETMFGAMANPMGLPEGLAPLFDEIARALALPRFADLPRVDAEALPSLGSSFEMLLLLQQYFAALVPVWMKACDNFQTEIRERREKGQKLDLASDGVDLWNDALDRTLMEFNRSADFGELQKKVLRMSMAQRKTLRRQVEIASEAMDVPTRAEMLDVYGRLHALMREVHGLRREVRSLKAARAEASEQVEAAPRPRVRAGGRR